MTKNIIFQTVNSIGQVPQEAWDTMVENNPYMTWGWLKTVEETSINKHDVYYLMALYQDQLVGGAVCSVTEHSLKEINIDDTIFGRLKKYFNLFNISMAPLLDCSPLRGRGTHLLISDTLNEKTKQNLSEALLEKIENLADKNKLAVAFSGVIGDQKSLRMTLAGRGYCRTQSYPIGILDIRWPDFDSYRNDKSILSKNTRKNINRQINKNKKAGVVIKEIQSADEFAGRLHELRTMNYEKHNKIPFFFNTSFYSTVKKNLGDQAALFIAERHGEVIGVKLLLKWKGYASSGQIGVDHEKDGNNCTYFNLGYYSTIDHAIQSNLKRIDYGNGMYQVKARQGCHIMPTYLYFKPTRTLQKIVIPFWFHFHSFWFNRKHSALIGQHCQEMY